ncbi:hypothetical protein BO70DRAFT_331057 [Aspergillus heteromorphus CBS 117.55]|uniref:Zn(2)-C6 fungal-type domain-containing protein n=1 Tax=Aspergillus heteromorphus CBS 117.55 TaxID=1448321 RepID=A0A317WS41_9EURO|nr:uncharacterized protein BO70DRAFT_331057 [Aspergillus heteromorphus CBS 117.55]PWY89189.1 hypothetical protein BO70DRAFT_331057 [Aspergillus heteromorphus CBS 117.55]
MPPLRRKNGREPACEACRLRKLACDHEQPSCRRCHRLSLKCIYLANPLAKVPRSIPAPASTTTTTTTSPIPIQAPPPSNPNQDPAVVSSKTCCPGAESTTPIVESSAEYLGPTSFTSVFVEHRDRFEVDDALRTSSSAVGTTTPPTSSSNPPAAPTPDEPTIPPRIIHLGVQILQNIPDQETCDSLFEKLSPLMDACLRPAYRLGSDLTWSEYRSQLTSSTTSSTPSPLQTMAHRISIASLSPLHPSDSPRRWVESFSGKQTRWEFLGTLFTYWSAGAALMSPGGESEASRAYRARRGVKAGSRDLMVHLKRCAAMCMELCSQIGAVNALFVHLAYKHNILESMASGDKSLSFWRQHGDVIAVTTSIGLHREMSSEWDKVSFQHEIKRRLYASIYNFDKVISTFTGRPPLLNRRYSTTQLPREISDEDIMSEAGLSGALAHLDANGWDRSAGRTLYPTTLLRARAMLAKNREAILEVLETSQDSITESAVQECFQLKASAHEMFAQFPDDLTFKDEYIDDADVPGPVLFLRILVRLDFLLSMFILERLLTRHKVVTEQTLIHVSQEMLGLTLIFWKHKDRFVNHHDFSWLAMSYAAPCSGILCLELLRQASHPQSYTLDLPRSEIIQNLSLLVAFLDWLRPWESDGAVRTQIKAILQRSLDRILSMPASLCGPMPAFEDRSVSMGIPDFAGAEYPHLELLNTFGWVDWGAGV